MMKVGNQGEDLTSATKRRTNTNAHLLRATQRKILAFFAGIFFDNQLFNFLTVFSPEFHVFFPRFLLYIEKNLF